ncbi:MAG TPA: shikimate kinase [Polyangia bacterium]|jgi:shikimate kinase|nr:shikimate kinase [Polyangia bacterium]
MPPADDDAPIFLIGFMASGKTTVGRLLAERLDWTFVDLDKVIEDEAAQTVADIFAAEGEAGFRKRETAALLAVAKRRKVIVATGGGAPCRDENIEAMLAAGRVFWLDVSPEEAVRRAGSASGRPLLDGTADPLAAARALVAARRPFYQRAHAGVVTNDQSPSQIVNELLQVSMVIGALSDGEQNDDANQ